MRYWGYAPSDQDLGLIRNAREGFRAKWESIRPPYPAAFQGTVEDVTAISYMQYEGIEFPPCGEEGAALICGEVLRATAKLQWVIDYRGEWFITMHEDDWPRIAISPVARLKELEYGGPQHDRFTLFLSRAAIDCPPFVDPETQAEVRKLIAVNHDGLEGLELLIKLAKKR